MAEAISEVVRLLMLLVARAAEVGMEGMRIEEMAMEAVVVTEEVGIAV